MDLPSSPCGAGVAAIGKEIWLSRILEHYCRECIVEDDSACTGLAQRSLGLVKLCVPMIGYMEVFHASVVKR